MRSNFTTFIPGADYQFTSKLQGLIGYYHNGEGTTNRSTYQLQRLIDGVIMNLARDCVALEASYRVYPLVTASVPTIGNMTDGSRFFSGTLSSSAPDNPSLTPGGQPFPGGEFSDYRSYPASVFLKGEYFF